MRFRGLTGGHRVIVLVHASNNENKHEANLSFLGCVGLANRLQQW